MTNQMWKGRKMGKQMTTHVSVLHPRVLGKMENVKGVELGLKQKWRHNELNFEYEVYGISKQRHIKNGPHTRPKIRETLSILGGGEASNI